jgi:hypothetical protein
MSSTIDFLKEVQEKNKKIPSAEKGKLQRYVKQVLALDEGGRVKVDPEKGGISCGQSVKNKDYTKTKIFKDLISYLGEFPSLKLLFDLLKYYLEKRRKLSQELLPALMQQIGIMDCTFEDGHTVEIGTDYRIAVVDEDEFYSWLKKKGYGDHVKMNLALRQEDYTDELRDYLSERGLSYEREMRIHWQTRNKIIRDRITAGEDLPDETILKVNPIEKAEIK